MELYKEWDALYNNYKYGFNEIKNAFDKEAFYEKLDQEYTEHAPEEIDHTKYIRINFSETDSKEAVAYLKEALQLKKENNYEMAAERLKSALLMDTTEKLYEILHQQLEICYRELKNYKKAEESLFYLLALKKNFLVYKDLISLYEISNQILKKYALRDGIRTLDTKNEVEKIILIDLLIKVKDFCGAIDYCKKYLKEEPNNIPFNRKLIESYIENENFEDAQNHLDYLVEQGHEKKYLYELCEFYHKLSDLESSFSYGKQLLDKYSLKTYWRYGALLGLTMINASYDDSLNDDYYIEKMKALASISVKEENKTFIRDTKFFRDMKVGFISYDFCTHPVGYFILSLFEGEHDYRGMQTYCYYTRPNKTDYITETIEKIATCFRNVSELDEQIILEIILKDELDILIDLSGTTKGNKLGMLSKRLAPIQITWMGFPSSTFIPTMDYLIGDYYTDPIGVTEKFLVEKPLRMPKNYLCYPYDFDYLIDELPFKRNGYITFASLNNPIKLTNTCLKMWAEILSQVPGSKLMIQNKLMDAPFLLKKFKERIAANGIDLDRVIFGRTKNFKEYMRDYNKVDIVLDTYPYNGVTTTFEGFFMGVPIINLRGNKRHSRCAYSLLAHVGLEDLSAETEGEYIAKAVELSNDIERLSHIRKTLRETTFNSPLCDTAGFRFDFENKLRSVYTKYCVDNKKEFVLEYEDLDELVKTNVIAIQFIKSILSDIDKDEAKNLKYLSDELKIITNELVHKLEDVYNEDSGAMQLIGNLEMLLSVFFASPLIGIDNHQTLIKMLDSILKLILKLV